jgi:hypothetical protein
LYKGFIGPLATLVIGQLQHFGFHAFSFVALLVRLCGSSGESRDTADKEKEVCT